MGEGQLGPAEHPCGSCPYRRDAPSGLWHESMYEILPRFDEPETYKQPPNAFGCHQQDGHLCAGWVGCHDMSKSLAIRLIAHDMAPGELDRTLDYASPVPLFGSGQEAYEHGMRDYENPGRKAQSMRRTLMRKLPGRITEA